MTGLRHPMGGVPRSATAFPPPSTLWSTILIRRIGLVADAARELDLALDFAGDPSERLFAAIQNNGTTLDEFITWLNGFVATAKRICGTARPEPPSHRERSGASRGRRQRAAPNPRGRDPQRRLVRRALEELQVNLQGIASPNPEAVKVPAETVTRVMAPRQPGVNDGHERPGPTHGSNSTGCSARSSSAILAPCSSERPEAAEGLDRFFDTLEERAEAADASVAPPPDGGLAQLVGFGTDAAGCVGRAYQPRGSRSMTTRSPRNASSLSATSTTSTSTSDWGCSEPCSPCSSSSLPAPSASRPVPGPTPSTSSTGGRCCATRSGSVSRRTGGSSATPPRGRRRGAAERCLPPPLRPVRHQRRRVLP